MIITCASCMTKFNLDDSRIPPKGTKVRCSKCRHVFHVSPAHETKEEARYGDYHEELPGPGQKEVKPPLHIEEEEELEEPFLSEKASPVESAKKEKEEKKGKAFTAKKVVQGERKGISLFFILFAIVVLLVFVAFYLLTELRSGGKLLPYLEYPIKKITEFLQQIF
jgi:predicted Zn finger-like uncharacterized protein